MKHKLKIFFQKNISVILLDADGVFYDGTEIRAVIQEKEIILKRRHFHDGQGLSFMRAMGLRILFVSGEGEPLEHHIAKFNKLPSCQSGNWMPVEFCHRVSGKGKKEAIEMWLRENGFKWEDCIYMGDDVNDLAAMRAVMECGGVTIAPANATRTVRAFVHHVTVCDGGNGAIRELAEMIMDARNIDESTLAIQ